MHFCPDSPEIYEQPQNQSVAQPSTATFVCSAVGNPKPTLTWQRLSNGVVTTINQSSKYGIVIASTGDQTQNQTSTLMIFNTSPGDTSQYTCFAENIQGHTQSTVTLSVRGECNMFKFGTLHYLCHVFYRYPHHIPSSTGQHCVTINHSYLWLQCQWATYSWNRMVPAITQWNITAHRRWGELLCLIICYWNELDQPIVHNNCHGHGCRNFCLPCKQWRNNILLKLSYP